MIQVINIHCVDTGIRQTISQEYAPVPTVDSRIIIGSQLRYVKEVIFEYKVTMDNTIVTIDVLVSREENVNDKI